MQTFKPIPALSEKDWQRLWQKVQLGNREECWNWTAATSVPGYGCFMMPGGKLLRVTRIVASYYLGPPPSNSHYACHRCDNPRCVNPWHLFWGTNQENILDAVGKRRHRTTPKPGEKNPSAKLSPPEVKAIRASKLGSRPLAKLYGVCATTIKDIRAGRAWI